ncbi:DUF4264 family protein [Tumebacillus algifaecis]|uniref:DUF4264 family protein n=1 Tax=Tumebacillus algifaecis TaxID=1214604 RepID=UPI0012FDEB5F|nr:DUF4264 family protein [Tumebacillus algifaecis]
MEETKLVTLGMAEFDNPSDLYYVVDFLNHTLKERGFVFGLSKGEEGLLNISVYEEYDQ